VQTQRCPATVFRGINSISQNTRRYQYIPNYILRGTEGKNIMTDKHTIFVCQSCAGNWRDGRQVGNSGGYILHQELMAQLPKHPASEQFQVRTVKCMGACNRPCAVAFAAAGKSTYLFGDISHTQSLAEMSESILECASLYHSKPDGVMKWSDRPERLKKGVVGIIPSIELSVSI
jgi:predicted metal-binding protein